MLLLALSLLLTTTPHPALDGDHSLIPEGFGAVFLQAMNLGAREPTIMALAGGRVVAEGRLGRRLLLAPGDYTLRLGGDRTASTLTLKVHVEAGETTVPEPDWSSLEIEVVTRQFVPFRGSYELIRMATRQDVGIGFGADEQQAESLRIWLLRPGLYKIIRPGGTYRDRQSFATVRLAPGTSTRYVLVQDVLSGEFLGAGEIDPGESGAVSASNWRTRGVLGGSIEFNSGAAKAGDGQDAPQVGLSAFFDARILYEAERSKLLTTFEVAEGHFRLAEREVFARNVDRLYAHTIYTYRVQPWFGPYIRSGVETRLFPGIFDFDSPRQLEPGLDCELGTADACDRVRLGSAFSPSIFQQGLGVNFTALKFAQLQLDARGGLGARQFLTRDQIELDTGGDIVTASAVPNASTEGVESSIIALAQWSRWLNFNSEFSALFPFRGGAAVLTWRNRIGLRLGRLASFQYRGETRRGPETDNTLRSTHELQLRFSVTLF